MFPTSFFQVFGLFGGLAHGQDRGRTGHGVTDTDDGFLRDARLVTLDHREHAGAHKREEQTHNVRAGAMRLDAVEHRDRRAQRRDLSQRQIDEDHAAFHYMHAEISVNAGEDQAGHEGREEEVISVHLFGVREGGRQKVDVVVE